MSTGSQIGNVFGSLGSGVATVGGPVGAGIGAAFSVLGGIIGMGSQIGQKKREEEKRKRELAEAMRRKGAAEAQELGESGSNERTQTATPATEPAQPEQLGTAAINTQQQQEGQAQLPQQAAVMGLELANVFAGLKPGAGGFFA